MHSFQKFVRGTVKPPAAPSDAQLLARLEGGWSIVEAPRRAPANGQDDAALLASLEDGWGSPEEPIPPAAREDRTRPDAKSRPARDPDEDRLPTLSDHEALKALLSSPFEGRHAQAVATPSTDGGVTHPRTIELTVQPDEEETPFFLTLRKDLRPRASRTLEPVTTEGE